MVLVRYIVGHPAENILSTTSHISFLPQPIVSINIICFALNLIVRLLGIWYYIIMRFHRHEIVFVV